MQFNKIPTTSYVNATRDEGMISKGIGWGGIIQTIDLNVIERTHKNLNYPFCLIHPIIYFFQKLVEVLNSLGNGRVWESKFVLGKPSVLGKKNFVYGES